MFEIVSEAIVETIFEIVLRAATRFLRLVTPAVTSNELYRVN